jgi:hypothetical protein
VIGAHVASKLERGLHQRTPESLPAPVGSHVELRQVALERLRPDSRAAAQHREPVRPGSSDEHRDLPFGEELPHALGELARGGRDVVELGVEVV